MERKNNEDPILKSKSDGLIISISEDELQRPSIVSKDTDKVSVFPKSEDQVPTERKNVDTDEIEVLNITFWIRKS